MMMMMMSPCCHAYNKDNVLVDYGDTINIFKTGDEANIVENMDLYSFPYIDNVSTFFVQKRLSITYD